MSARVQQAAFLHFTISCNVQNIGCDEHPPTLSIFCCIFTARVAKRAKVMFLQACVTHSVQQRGGGGGSETPKVSGQHLPPPPRDEVTTPPSPPWDQVTTPPSPPPGNRSQHLPPSPPGTGHNTSLPPSPLGTGHNTTLLPGPGHNTSPPPPGPGHNTSPPPPRTRSQHLPSPRDQLTTPPSPPRAQITTPPSPPPGHRSQHHPPSPPPRLHAGGRYASYWNAFLFDMLLTKYYVYTLGPTYNENKKIFQSNGSCPL